jgi:hypothetical protein
MVNVLHIANIALGVINTALYFAPTQSGGGRPFNLWAGGYCLGVGVMGLFA